MNALEKHYFQRCKEKYTSLGFKRLRRTYIRINGEYIQYFYLKKAWNAPRYTVEFETWPMYIKMFDFEKDFNCANFDVGDFYETKNPLYWPFMYDPTSDSDMIATAEILLQFIDKYIIPYFDICTDSHSAYAATIQLFDERHRTCSRFCANEGRDELKYYDMRVHNMALKARDYAFAKEYLIRIIQNNESALLDDYRTQEAIAEILARLEWMKEILHNVNLENDLYFDRYFSENISEMHEYIRKKYPQIAKKA